MPTLSLHRLLAGLLLLACAAAAYKLTQHAAPAAFQLPLRSATPDAAAMHTDFVSRQTDLATHAASLIELRDGSVRAFWFAGSREGAPDVTIRSAVFDGQSWSAERDVIDRERTQQGVARYVKKLGNPVAARAPDGALWLYYVTVSLGGWAGSSLTTLTSHDEGQTWSAPRRLITSPFLNISTLIKGTPFAYADGTLGLPVYHEFLGKFGELLHLSASGAVLDKQRLSAGKAGIQPIVLIDTPQQALVLMRYTNAPPMRILATRSRDAGQHWDTPGKTGLPNPDAAISGVSLGDGRMVLALNDVEQGRETLSLWVSRDHGNSWQPLWRLEDQRGQSHAPDDFAQQAAQLARSSDSRIDAQSYARSAQRNRCDGGHCAAEFSYPYLIQTARGEFHLVYTWNRSFIKHVQFNRAWLDARIKENDATAH